MLEVHLFVAFSTKPVTYPINEIDMKLFIRVWELTWNVQYIDYIKSSDISNRIV